MSTLSYAVQILLWKFSAIESAKTWRTCLYLVCILVKFTKIVSDGNIVYSCFSIKTGILLCLLRAWTSFNRQSEGQYCETVENKVISSYSKKKIWYYHTLAETTVDRKRSPSRMLMKAWRVVWVMRRQPRHTGRTLICCIRVRSHGPLIHASGFSAYDIFVLALPRWAACLVGGGNQQVLWPDCCCTRWPGQPSIIDPVTNVANVRRLCASILVSTS